MEIQLINSLHDIPGIEQYISPGTRSTSPAYNLHPSSIPKFDSVLWRYMDFTKFVSILDKRALFFSRADKLGDPFEGAWSDATIKALRLDDKKQVLVDDKRVIISDSHAGSFLPLSRPVTVDATGSESRADEAKTIQAWKMIVKGVRIQPRFTLLNCWHENENESEAMWKLYSGHIYGVAVKTCFGNLIKSFVRRLPNIVARVNYIPYQSTIMPLHPSAPFLHKRIGFMYEQEVRALITEYNYREDPNGRDDVKDIDFSKDVCDVGIHYDVNPDQLIQEVVVSPYAAPWLVELTRSVIERYGFQFQ